MARPYGASPRSVTLDQTSGASQWIPVHHRNAPLGVSFAVNVSGGGSLTYSVQYTLDDVTASSAGALAFDHTTVSGKAADDSGSFLFPISAVRINVAQVSASAQATLYVLQTDN